MLRSDQPSFGCAHVCDVRSAAASKPATTASLPSEPAGLHAIPRTAVQRHRLWGQFLPCGAADAQSRRHGFLGMGKFPYPRTIGLIADVQKPEWICLMYIGTLAVEEFHTGTTIYVLQESMNSARDTSSHLSQRLLVIPKIKYFFSVLIHRWTRSSAIDLLYGM